MEFNKSKLSGIVCFKKETLTGMSTTCEGSCHLGVTVSSDFTWSKHIQVIVAKANKTLGFIKRLFKDTSDLKGTKIVYYNITE